MNVQEVEKTYIALQKVLGAAFLPYIQNTKEHFRYRSVIVPLQNGKASPPCEIYTGLNAEALLFETPCLALDCKAAATLSQRCADLAKSAGLSETVRIEFRIRDDGQIYFASTTMGQSVFHKLCDQAERSGWSMGCYVWTRSAGSLLHYSFRLDGSFKAITALKADGGKSFSKGDLMTSFMAWGEDRGQAHMALAYGLDALEIDGVATTRSLTSAVLAHDRFMRGDMSEAFMDEEYPEGFSVVDLGIGHSRHVAAICAILRARAQNITKQSHWDVQVNDDTFTVELSGTGQVILAAIDEDSDKATVEIEVTTDWNVGERVVTVMIDDRKMIVQASKVQNGYDVDYRGGKLKATVFPRG